MLALLLLSCNDIGFKAVSITPNWGWADGCTAVTIGGHGFAADASATVGGTALSEVTQPDAKEQPLDAGYRFWGVTPPGEVGEATVEVSSGGEKSEVNGGFRYVACPAAVVVDAYSPTSGVSAGTTITIQGCGLDAGALRAKVGDADPVALTAGCSTASVSFAAPDLPAGAYNVVLIDASDAVVYPASDDTGDTAWTAQPDLTVEYGG